MYKVIINNDGTETMIHSPHVDGMKLQSGTIKKEINLIDSFNFSFHVDNPGFHKIKPLKTLISVLNTKTGRYEFEGRVLGPSKHMDNSGLHIDSYLCEGELGYLHDSIQQHLEFRGTPYELLTIILNCHNSQVEEYKRFKIGQVTVTNSTNNLYLYLSAEKDSFETIKEKLIDKLDGELQIRKINGVRFLDLVERIGEDTNTEIRIAKNLISMECDVDPTQIVTRLTPLGARVESKTEGATDASEARLTIREVNGGLDYIDNPVLIQEFGIQGGSITWDDVTMPNNLFTKGKEWLFNQKAVHIQYKIDALDLSLIGLDINSFKVGNSYPVKNPIMGIDENLRVVGKSIDINHPQAAALTIGDKFKTLNQYQSDLKKTSKNIGELQTTVFNQSNKISTLSSSLTLAKNELQALQESVGDVDLQVVLKTINDLEVNLQKIEEGLKDIPSEESIEQIRKSTEKNVKSISNLKDTIDLLKIDVKNMNEKIEKSQEKLSLLEKRVAALEGSGGVEDGTNK